MKAEADAERSFIRTTQLNPEGSFYVAGDDRLYVAASSSVASLTVRFSGYFLDVRGDINQYAIDVFPTSDRALTASVAFLGEGFLLSCIASLAVGSAARGQCYVRARIQRGTGANLVPIAQILAGYVSDSFSPCYPVGEFEIPVAEPGYLRSNIIVTAAVGALPSTTVPTGATWRVVSAFGRLTTDATVVNRFVFLSYLVSTVIVVQTAPTMAIPASQIRDMTWGIGAGSANDSTSTALSQGLIDVRLPAGTQIMFRVVGITAGDAMTICNLTVEEWLVP